MISAIPGNRFMVSDGRISLVPLMVTGRIGRFRSKANQKAPFLNGSISCVLLRVPSGKISMEVPSLIFDFAKLMVSIAALVLDLSIRMWPIA